MNAYSRSIMQELIDKIKKYLIYLFIPKEIEPPTLSEQLGRIQTDKFKFVNLVRLNTGEISTYRNNIKDFVLLLKEYTKFLNSKRNITSSFFTLSKTEVTFTRFLLVADEGYVDTAGELEKFCHEAVVFLSTVETLTEKERLTHPWIASITEEIETITSRLLSVQEVI